VVRRNENGSPLTPLMLRESPGSQHCQLFYRVPCCRRLPAETFVPRTATCPWIAIRQTIVKHARWRARTQLIALHALPALIEVPTRFHE
jgi:hypothetical protein